ncbi:MAG TPA: hypothetical protein VGS03_09515 [Candidatus Polarisedimenticolia bacterium]|nr:hypothetical protein [Candidatus Polarisedimenticolia bacterium]
MKRTLTLLGIALCVASLAQAAPGKAQQAETVGQFIANLAAAVTGEPQTLRSAQDTMRRLGSTGDFNASAALTEGFVARMANELGVNMTPGANASTPVSPARSTAIVGRLAAYLEAKPIYMTDGLPTQCLSSSNRGECVNCCKETGAPANQCAHFCVSNIPSPPSEDEPQP